MSRASRSIQYHKNYRYNISPGFLSLANFSLGSPKPWPKSKSLVCISLSTAVGRKLLLVPLQSKSTLKKQPFHQYNISIEPCQYRLFIPFQHRSKLKPQHERQFSCWTGTGLGRYRCPGGLFWDFLAPKCPTAGFRSAFRRSAAASMTLHSRWEGIPVTSMLQAAEPYLLLENIPISSKLWRSSGHTYKQSATGKTLLYLKEWLF